jgi:hypothetical protein
MLSVAIILDRLEQWFMANELERLWEELDMA